MSGWQILGVALGGGVGSGLRFVIACVIQRFAGTGFPLGTAVVNLAGCFCFGLIFSLSQGIWPLSRQARLVLLSGVMGGLTTFSTFIFETTTLISQGQILQGCISLLVQLLGGAAFFGCGLLLGRGV